MAKRRIKNTITGEILIIDDEDPKQLAKYGVSSSSAKTITKKDEKKDKDKDEEDEPKEKPADTRSVAQGNLASPNLIQGGSLLRDIVNAIAQPAVQTAQVFPGVGFELGRFISPERQGGTPTKNPFLSEERLMKASTDPVGATIDQIKNSAALASFGIPITRGLGVGQTALRGGAVGGAQSLPTAESPEDVAIGIGAGATFAPALMKVLGAGQGLRGAVESGKQSMMNIKAASGPKVAQTREAIFKKVREVGSKYGEDLTSGSAASREVKMGNVYSRIQNNIDNWIDNNPIRLGKKDTTLETIESIVRDRGDHFVPENKSIEGILKREVELLGRQIGNIKGEGVLYLEDLNKMVIAAANRVGKNGWKAITDPGSRTPSPKEGIAYDLYKAADELLEKWGGDVVKSLKGEQSTLYQLAPGLEQLATRSEVVRPFGVPTGTGAQRPIQAGQSKILNLLGMTGTGLDKVLSPLEKSIQQHPQLGNILTRGATSRVTEPKQNEVPAPVKEVVSEGERGIPAHNEMIKRMRDEGLVELSDAELQEQIRESYITGKSPQEHEFALQQAERANDKDAIKILANRLEREQSHQKALGNKSSGSMQAAEEFFQLARGTLDDIVDNRNVFGYGPVQGRIYEQQLSLLGGQGVPRETIDLSINYRMLKLNMLRAYQGARISDKDYELADRYTPNLMQTNQTAVINLFALHKALNRSNPNNKGNTGKYMDDAEAQIKQLEGEISQLQQLVF